MIQSKKVLLNVVNIFNYRMHDKYYAKYIAKEDELIFIHMKIYIP